MRLVAVAVLCMAVAVVGQERDRAKVDAKYTWNLADIYPDVAAWRAARTRVAAEVPRVRAYAGTLGSSAQTLADALEEMTRLDKEIARLYAYASMLADQDTRLSEPQGMQQEMQQLHAEFTAQASYIQPEILRIGSATVEQFLASEPRLAVYAFYLRDIVRRAAHTLTDAEEKLLADAQPLAASASNIYGILSNADFPYPTITLSDGRRAKVDQAGYAELRTHPERQDRQAAMSAFFGALGGFGRTFGTTMNSSLQKAVFYAKARKYGSTLEASLDRPNIPVSVYRRLIDGVNRHLPTFHRYLRLRKRMMGITDDLRYYDLYAPLVASVHLRYTPEQAQQLVLTSSAPLGGDYVSVLRRAFAERWLDWFPADGKRSGAYSNGAAYDVHPYILLNYLGQYNDVSTLAHELGHTMHSYSSNTRQPYPLADYPTFVAEVASTFNEALLIDYMLREIKDEPTRLSLLGNYLENIKATVFRQTQFAEFELRMHEMAWRGEPITGEALATLYYEITKRYYGHDQGVLVVDEYVAHEWSYIPHFYSDFYVFQYATSFTAAETLAARVLAGDRDATTRYLTFLGSGGSKYPIDLRKKYVKDIARVCQKLHDVSLKSLDAGALPLVLGGDHSLAAGSVAASAAWVQRTVSRPLGLIWVDAHGDMNTPATTTSGNVHGMPLAALLGNEPMELASIGFSPSVLPRHTVLVGLRNLDEQEKAPIRRSGVHVFTMKDIDRDGIARVAERAIALAAEGTGGVHVSFDMDVCDPAIAPGVGTAVKGGLDYREAHMVMELVADSGRLVALDLVEINPTLDIRNTTAELACELALSALGKRIL